MSRLIRALATVGFLGDLAPAPGTTVGSLAGLLLFIVCFGTSWQLPLGVLLTLVSFPVCGLEARRRHERDPGAVVLDELVGQWWALQILAWSGVPKQFFWLTLAFLVFRLLDVLKPPPVGTAENLPGGLGIVADDLVAGLLAGGLVSVAFLAGRSFLH